MKKSRRLLVRALWILCIINGGLRAQHGVLLEATSNDFKINLGTVSGVAVGMTGRVFLEQRIGGENVRIYVAKFVVRKANTDTSEAQILQRTELVKPGYFVQFDTPLVPVTDQSVAKPAVVAARPAPLPEKNRKPAEDIERDFRSYVDQAEFCFSKGDYPKAFEYYTKAQQEKPQEGEVRTRLTKLQRIMRGEIAVVEDMRIEPLRFKPYEGSTNIHFTLSTQSGVNLRIKRAIGQNNVFESELANARQSYFSWDGVQRGGRIVEDGEYEYTVQTTKYGGSESLRTKKVEIKVHAPFGVNLLPAYEPKLRKASLSSTGNGIVIGALIGAVLSVDEGETRGGNALTYALSLGGIGLFIDLIDMMGIGPHNKAELKKAKEVEEHNNRVKRSLTIEQKELR